MKTTRLMSVALLLFVAAAATLAQAAEYNIDPDHTSVRFQIKHLAISKVNGAFGDVAGSFRFDPDRPETWQAEATIGVASIDTGNAKRDDHLRSDEFFDAARLPRMTFKSTGVQMSSASEGQLQGELTMHGVTKPVTLDLEYNGSVQDPWGNQRAGFSLTGTFDRRNWGLTYNAALESGGLVIGHDVKISLEVEGIRAK